MPIGMNCGPRPVYTPYIGMSRSLRTNCGGSPKSGSSACDSSACGGSWCQRGQLRAVLRGDYVFRLIALGVQRGLLGRWLAICRGVAIKRRRIGDKRLRVGGVLVARILVGGDAVCGVLTGGICFICMSAIRVLTVRILPGYVLSIRALTVRVLPGHVLGVRARAVGVPPGSVLGIRALTVRVPPGSVLDIRALTVRVLPGYVLSIRALTIRVPSGHVLGIRARAVRALPGGVFTVCARVGASGCMAVRPAYWPCCCSTCICCDGS